MSDDCKPIRMLAVDDHPLPRQGFASLIAEEPDMTLVEEASNGREAILSLYVRPFPFGNLLV